MFEKLKKFLFKNSTGKQTVVKNTFWLSVSNFGGRILRAGLVIYAARILGTSEWGIFSYAITLAGFMALFIDPGINAILTRNTAKSSETERQTIFSTTFIIKIFLIVIGASVVIFIGPSFSTLPGAKMLLPITACILTFDAFRDFFSALLRGQEKMEWDAYIQVLMNAAILVFGLIALSLHTSARSIAFGYALGTLTGMLTAAFIVRHYLKDVFKSFSLKLVTPILQSAWPFAITGALGLLLTNADILIVSWMRTAADVGIYSAAIRIIQVLYLIPTVIQYGTLPSFSRLASDDRARFRAALEKTLAFIFLASIPLAIGGAILGTGIMTLVFGASYAGGSLAFKILMITMLIDFPAAVLSNAIFAHDHQKNLIITSAIAGVLNVAFDLILIPPFGIVGSAIGTLLAQAASNWYLWRTMKRINPFSVLSRLGRMTAAGILMGGTAWFLMHVGLNVVLNIILSGGVYCVGLFLLREPILKEIKSAFHPKNSASGTDLQNISAI